MFQVHKEVTTIVEVGHQIEFGSVLESKAEADYERMD